MTAVEKVYLAPMEGVCDPPLRKILCAAGGYDECFSEFIRVTDVTLPAKTLLREVPELKNDCRTPDGTPVRVQLLGDNPEAMALSARRAVSLGAHSIDLNFGCPSRFVHHAGAMLLREPELMARIISTVREALPQEILLSVKMRLGFASTDEAPYLIKAAAQPGVGEIIVHARTRRELYRQEALHWDLLPRLQEIAGDIPLTANGDIVDAASAARCVQQSGCRRLMTGRAALTEPNLGHMIKEGAAPLTYRAKLEMLPGLFAELERWDFAEKSRLDRAKQFLGFVRRSDARCAEFFKTFCRAGSQSEALLLLDAELKALDAAQA